MVLAWRSQLTIGSIRAVTGVLVPSAAAVPAVSAVSAGSAAAEVHPQHAANQQDPDPIAA